MPTNGNLLWSNDWSAGNTANCPTPAYANGYVFWSNGYGKGGICLKLKKEDGKVTADVAWKTHDMVCHHGGYVIHEGCIYGNHEGGWTCLDLKTGKKKWNEQAVGKGSLCFADGMLYLFGESGGKAALATCSPEGLKLKGKVQGQGRRSQLGPSGGRRRTALPPLRQAPVLLRREAGGVDIYFTAHTTSTAGDSSTRTTRWLSVSATYTRPPRPTLTAIGQPNGISGAGTALPAPRESGLP